MPMKTIVISILAVAVLIGGAILFSGGNKNKTSGTGPAANNVSMLDGKQIITINAKGGYSPKVTAAKADVPTIIKMDTLGTFDCSSLLTIPSLGINKNLPPSGETEIEVPPQTSGTTLRGLCAMGMFSFAINFN